MLQTLSDNISSYSGSLTYEFGGRNGSAVATFDAPSAGEYTLAMDDIPFAESLAVGPSFAGDLVRTLIGSFAIGGFGAVVGGAIVGVTALGRARAKRDRSRPPRAAGWAPPPPA